MTDDRTARSRQRVAVYSAGLIQGVALVTFPAASAVFTSASQYGLSSTQYGGIFVPQAIMAIGAALLGAALTRRLGVRRIYLLGLVANLLAMLLLVGSAFIMHERTLAYAVLLAATSCLGAGFGLTVPAVNTFAAAFSPRKVDRAVLALNALLGAGTTLAPVFVALFIGLGIWWGLPVLVSALLVGLLLFSARLPLRVNTRPDGTRSKHGRSGFPARFWLFAAFALLYGVCETINGNWASLYMTGQLHASAPQGALALTAFWGMVTAGRILFAAIDKWLPERVVCQILPLLAGIAFIATAFLRPGHTLPGIATFALAGLGCSALLPLVISFGQVELKTISASVAGGLIASYQLGYGVAAFGIGPLQTHAGLSLHTIFGWATVVALALAAFAVLIVRRPVGRMPQGGTAAPQPRI